MNFTTLKTELSDRGFAYLTDTRLGQYVNWAMHEFQSYQPWPWRLATSSTASWTTATIALTNCDRILSVGISSDATNFTMLAPMPYDEFAQLEESRTGTPKYYTAYSDPTTTTTTNVDLLPKTGTWTVKITYLISYADISGTTVPAVPGQYHITLVDIAARMAYRDVDNHDAAAAVQQSIDRDIARLAAARVSPELSTLDAPTGGPE